HAALLAHAQSLAHAEPRPARRVHVGVRRCVSAAALSHQQPHRRRGGWRDLRVLPVRDVASVAHPAALHGRDSAVAVLSAAAGGLRRVPPEGGSYRREERVPPEGGNDKRQRGPPEGGNDRRQRVPPEGGNYRREERVPPEGGSYGRRARVPPEGGSYRRRESVRPEGGNDRRTERGARSFRSFCSFRLQAERGGPGAGARARRPGALLRVLRRVRGT